jgi:hypothetical protein
MRRCEAVPGERCRGQRSSLIWLGEALGMVAGGTVTAYGAAKQVTHDQSHVRDCAIPDYGRRRFCRVVGSRDV